MLKLTPPLTVIEANLFDPSFAMLRRWSAESGARLSSADSVSPVAEPDRQELIRDWNECQAAIPHPPAATSPCPMPASLVAKIRQRIASQDRAPPLQPAPGLIVRIDRPIGPQGSLDWEMPQPLAVLLAGPTEERDLWQGWLMAWETDYASDGDLILDDQDDPHDPLAAMVQVWNPLQLYWPAASAVLGQLQPERLAAVRDLALEMSKTSPEPGTGRAGTLVQRATSGGHLVLTGMPLVDADDPRWRYREFYFAAADLVRNMARQSVSAHLPRPWWQSLLNAFQEGTRAAGLGLTPMPIAALGPAELEVERLEVERAASWQLADWLACRLIPGATGDSVRLQLRLLQSEPLLVGLQRGERVRQQARLTPEMPETALIAGADQGLTFFIRDATGATLFALPLRDDHG